MDAQFKRKWLNRLCNINISPWERAKHSKFLGQQRKAVYYGWFCLHLVLDFVNPLYIMVKYVIQRTGKIGVKSQSSRYSVNIWVKVMICVVGVTILLTFTVIDQTQPDIVHQRSQDCARALRRSQSPTTSLFGLGRIYDIIFPPLLYDVNNKTVSGMLLNCFLVSLKSAKYRSHVMTSVPKFFQPDNEKKLRLMPVINPHNPEFLIASANACLGHNVRTLVVSPSAPHFFARRQKVRKSNRGIFVKDFKNNSTLLFFIGLPHFESLTLLDDLKTEAKTYGDIVLVSAADEYRNILAKALAMLRWAVDFCPGARYVIRTDDDVNVTVTDLISVMENISKSHQDYIVGKKMVGDIPARDGNKWTLSEAEFPGHTLPTYVLGGLIGYPMTTVRLLYEATLRLASIWLDDVYITGMCSELMNISIFNDKRFVFEHYVNPEDYKPRGLMAISRSIPEGYKPRLYSDANRKQRRERFEQLLKKKQPRWG